MKRKKSNKEKGNAFEEKVKNTINSGAIGIHADLTTNQLCIECKYTDKKGFRVTSTILEKLFNAALDANKLPRLIIGLCRNDTDMFILNCDLTIQRK